MRPTQQSGGLLCRERRVETGSEHLVEFDCKEELYLGKSVWETDLREEALKVKLEEAGAKVTLK